MALKFLGMDKAVTVAEIVGPRLNEIRKYNTVGVLVGLVGDIYHFFLKYTGISTHGTLSLTRYSA